MAAAGDGDNDDVKCVCAANPFRRVQWNLRRKKKKKGDADAR